MFRSPSKSGTTALIWGSGGLLLFSKLLLSLRFAPIAVDEFVSNDSAKFVEVDAAN